MVFAVCLSLAHDKVDEIFSLLPSILFLPSSYIDWYSMFQFGVFLEIFGIFN